MCYGMFVVLVYCVCCELLVLSDLIGLCCSVLYVG